MAEDWAEEAAAGPGGPAVAVAELPEIKLFGKWSTDDVQVSDISLTVSFFSMKFLIQVYYKFCLSSEYFEQ